MRYYDLRLRCRVTAKTLHIYLDNLSDIFSYTEILNMLDDLCLAWKKYHDHIGVEIVPENLDLTIYMIQKKFTESSNKKLRGVLCNR